MLERGLETVLVGFFTIWFLTSLLCLVPRLRDRIRETDILTLIPEWKFFAPNPGIWDYALLYRDHLQDGITEDWTEAAVETPRAWWNGIWNPAKRGNKALVDCVVVLAKHLQAPDGSLEVTIPYLTLLNYVSSLPRLGGAQYTQFAIMKFDDRSLNEEPELMFVSPLHSL